MSVSLPREGLPRVSHCFDGWVSGLHRFLGAGFVDGVFNLFFDEASVMGVRHLRW